MISILETPRLLLREMSGDDIDFIYGLISDPEAMRYWPKCYSREEAAEWIERQEARYAKDGHGYYLAIRKDDLQPIGQAGLIMCEVEGEMEPALGYIIHRPFWRRGYAFEASAACIEFAFAAFKYGHLIALIRPENSPSVELARKLGLKPVAQTVYAGLLHLIFYISRDEWIIHKAQSSAESSSR